MSNKDESKRMSSMTEQRLHEVPVGDRPPLNDVIRIVPYNPEWKAIYTSEAKRIQDALGRSVLLLEHVGSTSVPGLSAKPIIDIVMAVENSIDEIAYVPALEAIGYTLRIREPNWYEHRMLNPPDDSFNLHVFSIGCEEIDRMLLFRDWLRSHPEDRIVYEDTKRELASRTWKYVQNYADAKSKVVQEILERASQGAS
jgi:GrpB-like predicted nucleotidyltransferase (UPF0157 family)